jgi:hypothetical protein
MSKRSAQVQALSGTILLLLCSGVAHAAAACSIPDDDWKGPAFPRIRVDIVYDSEVVLPYNNWEEPNQNYDDGRLPTGQELIITLEWDYPTSDTRHGPPYPPPPPRRPKLSWPFRPAP